MVKNVYNQSQLSRLGIQYHGDSVVCGWFGGSAYVYTKHVHEWACDKLLDAVTIAMESSHHFAQGGVCAHHPERWLSLFLW